MKKSPLVGVREDRKTGQYVPTVNGIDVSPTSFDRTRALAIASEVAAQSSESHTPGPWTFQPESADYYAAVTVEGCGLDVSICEFPEGEDCAANGRLMAASPELLSALQAALPLIPTFSPSGESQVETIEMARRAIAKATGN